MDYFTLRDGGDILQRNEGRMERKLHFIGRAYVCRNGGFKHEHFSEGDFRSCNGEEIQTRRKQDHEMTLKGKDVQMKNLELEAVMAKRVNDERKSRSDKVAMQMKHDHEIKLKKLDIELEEKKLKVEEVKARNLKELFTFLRNNNQSKIRGSKLNRESGMSQIHLDIDDTTGSISASADNNEVPSAINRILFN